MNQNVVNIATWSEPVLLRRKGNVKSPERGNFQSQYEIKIVSEDTDNINCKNSDCKCQNFAKKKESIGLKKAKSERDPKKIAKIDRRNSEENLQELKRKLEMTVSKYQIEESLAADAHNELVTRYEKLGTFLVALLQYVECVLLEYKASYRMCQQLNGLASNSNDNTLVVITTESLSQLVNKYYSDDSNSYVDRTDLKNNLMMAIDSSFNLTDLEEDYLRKKQDFETAIKNFKIILNNDCMNVQQLEKLGKQLDAILATYQQSRELLDQEFPDLISMRLNVLKDCLEKLGTELYFHGGRITEIGTLFKEMQASSVKNLVNTSTSTDNLVAEKNGDLINLTSTTT